MTEADWWGATEPEATIRRLQAPDGVQPAERKWDLFALACLRLAERHITDWHRHRAVNVLEEAADNRVSESEVREEADRPPDDTYPRAYAEEAISVALYYGAPTGCGRQRFITARVDQALADLIPMPAERARIFINYLHDIFGPLPFRGVAVDPRWLTSDVVALARGIYDEKAFDRLPILADALQDAGCDNDNILNHCRAENWEHVRGCWVVDLLLGKPWREPA